LKEDSLTPNIVFEVARLILEGIKTGLDLVDRKKAKKEARRQRKIALYLALMQLTESSGLPAEEVSRIRETLAHLLQADGLADE
jgi:hypothetical protein